MPQIQRETFNRNFNHLGITVPDCDAAVKFYTEIFGFRQVKAQATNDSRVDPDTPIFRIYGDSLKRVKVAFLVTGNGIGVEFFQFIDPPMSRPASFDYTQGGVFHICITDPDPDALCEKVLAAGGKQMGPIVEPYGNLKETDRAVYLVDPWGNTIEVLSCSFEQLLANRD